ncbi:MAG: T9SS type A sorting domain-containing protein [Saprospiraceae bacterium]
MKMIILGQPLRLLLALLFSIFCCSVLSAATVYSKKTGNWHIASTWQGGIVPTVLDNVVIKVGHTVTAFNNHIGQHNLSVYGTLIYPGHWVRSILPGSTLKIDGTLRLEGGTFTVKGATSGTGTFRQIAGNSSFEKSYVMTNTEILGGQILFGNTDSYEVLLDNFSLKNAIMYIPTVPALHIRKTMYWGNNGRTFGDTKIEIDEDATLTFEGGFSSYTNNGSILNRGTMICTAGSLNSSSGVGEIYNYGYMEFIVPANTAFTVSNHYVVNWGGEILKRGLGTLALSSSSHYLDAGEPLFHIQEGGIALFSESAGNELNGLWRVDAGAVLSVLAIDNNQYVRFAPDKFVNNGTVLGNVKFVGDDTTILEGNGRYDYVEIAKSGGEVTLTGSPEIKSKLTLTQGRVILNHHDLRLGTAATIAGGHQGSYIQTNGTGACQRFCPLSAHVYFPVGNGEYAPFLVQLGAGSTPDFIKVRATDTFYGEYIGGTSASACEEQVPVGIVGHNWVVAEQISGGSVAAAVAYWLPAAERSGFNRGNCTLGRYFGNDWQSNGFGPALAAGALYSAQRSNLTSFGLFGVYDASHVPDVNFIPPAPDSNSPLCEWDDLQLHAHTSPNTEVQWTGPNGFQSNLHNPTVLGIQQSQGGTYAVQASQYGCAAQQASVNVIVVSEADCPDLAPQTEQVLAASAPIKTKEANREMKIAPNPATDATLLTFESATDGEAQLSVTDLRGAQMLLQNVAIEIGQNQIGISLADFPAGTYLVTLIRAGEVKTVRAVKLMGE